MVTIIVLCAAFYTLLLTVSSADHYVNYPDTDLNMVGKDVYLNWTVCENDDMGCTKIRNPEKDDQDPKPIFFEMLNCSLECADYRKLDEEIKRSSYLGTPLTYEDVICRQFGSRHCKVWPGERRVHFQRINTNVSANTDCGRALIDFYADPDPSEMNNMFPEGEMLGLLPKCTAKCKVRTNLIRACGEEVHGNQLITKEDHGEEDHGNQLITKEDHGEEVHSNRLITKEDHGEEDHGNQLITKEDHGDEDHGNQLITNAMIILSAAFHTLLLTVPSADHYVNYPDTDLKMVGKDVYLNWTVCENDDMGCTKIRNPEKDDRDPKPIFFEILNCSLECADYPKLDEEIKRSSYLGMPLTYEDVICRQFGSRHCKVWPGERRVHFQRINTNVSANTDCGRALIDFYTDPDPSEMNNMFPEGEMLGLLPKCTAKCKVRTNLIRACGEEDHGNRLITNAIYFIFRMLAIM